MRYGARLANDGVSLVVQPGKSWRCSGKQGGQSPCLDAAPCALRSCRPIRRHGIATAAPPLRPSPERAIAAGISLIHQHFCSCRV